MAESSDLEKSNVTEQFQQFDEKSVVNRVSLSTACETCTKRERCRVVSIAPGEEIPNAAALFFAETENCSLVRESRVDGLHFLFFKCLDVDCYVRTLKETIRLYWTDEQMRARRMEEYRARAGHKVSRKERKRQLRKKLRAT